MIIVSVELYSAVTGKKTLLGRTAITNDGTGDFDRRNYDVNVARKTNAADARAILDNPLRKGRVENYPTPKLNVWRLVIRALRSAFPEEK